VQELDVAAAPRTQGGTLTRWTEPPLTSDDRSLMGDTTTPHRNSPLDSADDFVGIQWLLTVLGEQDATLAPSVETQ
jgi:hypothetical protein